jgi:AcrR family transcriptional regulator
MVETQQQILDAARGCLLDGGCANASTRRIAQSAGLALGHLHYHLRAGVSPLILAQVAGHTSIRMIEQVYSHLDATDGYTAIMRSLMSDQDGSER